MTKKEQSEERTVCGTCKYQPEPLCTCDWLKHQTTVFIECPRYEKKESEE